MKKMISAKKLSDYAYNIYSQFGEDGIIERIFKILGSSSKVCIEFGAWDGFYLSNTANLWTNGWKGILIEADKVKYISLVENVKKYDCHCINTFVSYEEPNTLENILKREGISGDVNFLSIDIDGDDYYVFESLKELKPRLIVCEYNPTIPIHMDIISEKGNYFGCSALSLVKLAEKKNYQLVAMTDTNCFFVRSTDFNKFEIYDTNIESIAPTKHLTYFITGYDGDYLLSKKPAYGCTRPSTQKFMGEYFAFTAKGSYDNSIRSLFKKFLKRTPIYPLILKVKLEREKRRIINNWEKMGEPIPPPNLIKQETVKEYAYKFSTQILIERGTYLCDMVFAMKDVFSQIYSIEIDSDLYMKAKDRFANVQNIHTIKGDSSKVLPDILTSIRQLCLFWLDGHYSGGITAKGDLDTPILEELKHIFAHTIKDHVILIDDARCFIGQKDYPTIKTLREFVAKERPNWVFEVKDDIIRIHKYIPDNISKDKFKRM